MLDLDVTTASLDELETLTLDDLLGQRMDEIDFVRHLPTGSYALQFDMDKTLQESLTRRAADFDNDKKASVSLSLRFRVVKALAVADSNIDPESLKGRFHTQRFFLTNDMGPRQVALLICGVIGLDPRNKEALAELGGALWQALEELRVNKVTFGCRVKQEERNGYDNCDIVFKYGDFVSAEQIGTLLD